MKGKSYGARRMMEAQDEEFCPYEQLHGFKIRFESMWLER
jgi:hypothetical protein